ncbi:MAG: Abi family protein [Planctomycetota bacterium]
MRYSKPPLTFEQQADQLIERGLCAPRKDLIDRLMTVSYYRLSGYLYPYRKRDPENPKKRLDNFQPGTTLEEVWKHYTFDRRLRMVVLDAIERIEVFTRTRLAYEHAHRYGPFAYATKPESLPDGTDKGREWFLESARKEAKRSNERFVKHFRVRYGDCHRDLPVWMAVEIMSFGAVLTFFRSCHGDMRRALAKPFEVHDTVFDSWLLALNTVRNVCARHARLWNRQLGTKPKIPGRNPIWSDPVKVKGDRIFGILSICKWSLDRIAPTSAWADRLRSLLDEYPSVSRSSMGFAENWRESGIWT